MTKDSKNIIVCISGAGRTLDNILKNQKKYNGYNVCGVISSNPEAGGLNIARIANLPVFIGDFSEQGRSKTSELLEKWAESLDFGWIILAGFIKLMPIFYKLLIFST